MAKEKRLNARITSDSHRKLQEIVRATGSNMSQVIMDAIELYYRQGPIPSGESPFEVAKKSGIIGCLKGGPNDLSVHYKHYLTEAVQRKHR